MKHILNATGMTYRIPFEPDACSHGGYLIAFLDMHCKLQVDQEVRLIHENAVEQWVALGWKTHIPIERPLAYVIWDGPILGIRYPGDGKYKSLEDYRAKVGGHDASGEPQPTTEGVSDKVPGGTAG